MKFGLVFIGAWLTETDAGIGDGRLLSRAVTSYQSCDARLGELELGILMVQTAKTLICLWEFHFGVS